MIESTEVEILRRIIEPDRPRLPVSVARLILEWKFSAADRKRMQILLEKSESGRMSRAERKEAEDYERIGHLLSMLKSKARISLKSKSTAS